MPVVVAVDQGTTGTTVLVFDRQGRVVGRAYSEFTQHYPKPGWVEHDAEEIWRVTLRVLRLACRRARVRARDVAALGITNQRETTLLWDRQSGRPVHRAIVWQDRRTASLCEELRARGLEDVFRQKTGLVLDPYFSGTKLRWLLEHVPRAAERARAGALAFGTIDTWLIWKLTGGVVHATDPTNASRTLLFDIHTGAWDAALCDLLQAPAALLPAVKPSSGEFGATEASILGAPVAIAGVAGDQQAALFGQGCVEPGMAKNTYGTGWSPPRRAMRAAGGRTRSRARCSSPVPPSSGCATGSGCSRRPPTRSGSPGASTRPSASTWCPPSWGSAPRTGTPRRAAPCSA